MFIIRLIFLFVIVGFIPVLHNTALCDVTVEPFGFTLSVEENEEAEVELILNNSGEEEVAFSIDYELVENEDDRQAGPRRDDPGDLLDEFETQYNETMGMAWDEDNGWIWVNNLNNPPRLYALNPEDGEIELDINWPDANQDSYRIGMFYHDGVLWTHGYNNDPTFIYRYDTEGNIVGDRIQSPFDRRFYMGTDGEHIYFNAGYNEDYSIHVYALDDLEEEIATIDYREAVGGQACRDIEWVSAHPRGQFWLGGHDDSHLYQCFVDDDWNCELVQDFDVSADDVQSTFGIGHDGENMWIGLYRANVRSLYVFDDGVREFHMLTFNPEEGIIPGEDSETVDVLVQSVNVEAGVYNVLIEIELSEPEDDRDDLEQALIEISAVVTVSDPTFDVSGAVTDAATEEVIEGVVIELDRYIITRFTDEDGAYDFTDLPSGDYEFTFAATDYLPITEAVEIGDNDVELDVALPHSECTPSRDDFFAELQPDANQEIDFTVTNGGNGLLTYTVECRLLGDANAEPWELREDENIEDVVQDDMLNGVVFADGHFFVTGGNNGENVSKIYKLNTDGELVDEFDQFRESRYGMRDLAYDGNLIWGADDGILYGFTTNGELQSEFESPADIECRSLTWEPDNRLLIASDISTNIFAIDLDGELVETFERPQELRIYGLAYWSEDPDGYCLYVFCRGDTTDLLVDKVNLEDGDYIVAAELNIDGGRPGGVQITSQLDVYSWVFVSIVQNPDRLAIWQLAARKEWFQIEPVEGVIEANESEDFVLTLDATDLPPENTFEGEVVFRHDGVGAETVLSVRLDVVAGEIHTTRDIPMEMGWNLVSANLQPDDEEDIRGLMAALVEEELLIIMKNSEGQFYRPDYDYNNIPGWYVDEGYQMLVSDDCALTLEGMSVSHNRPIPLEQGWQIVSYYPRQDMDAVVALSGIVDHLIIAKDGRGDFYIPAWDFCNIDIMREGQGYYLNVDEDVELVYQTEEANVMSGRSISQLSVYDSPGRLPVHAVTGENMSLLVVESAPPFDSPPAERGVGEKGKFHPAERGVGEKGKFYPAERERVIKTEASPMLLHERTSIPPLLLQGGSKGGSEIGVYAGGQLVGSGVLQDGVCGIAVWGDDPMTEEIDGAIDGQPLEVRLLNKSGLCSVSYEVLSGRTVYRTDSFAAIRLNAMSELPYKFGIVSAYPNPFNARTRIVYGLPEAARVDLAVYDLSGRRVSELASGRQEAGIHAMIFDGSGFASGVYMVRLETGSSKSQWKVALVK